MLNIGDCSSVLEVQLTSFNGQVTNKKNNLKWVSSAENNFSHYEVEKSEDGEKFVKAGSVPGLNKHSISSYDFTDGININIPVYYRLKMIGNDGLFKYSNTILLSNKNTAFHVNNIVNPFQNSLAVEYAIPNDGKIDFRLFDSYGKPVKKLTVKGKKGTNIITVDGLNNLAAGIYTVTIIFENVSISKRVVKVN